MPIIEKQGAEQAINQVTDNFDLDKSARGIARANGVPATWIRAQDEVDAGREEKAKQQNILSMVENIPGLAKALESAGKSPEAGSLGEQIQNAA